MTRAPEPSTMAPRPPPPPGTRALRELPAPAKLNLFLHVVGRRADGMHLLQSVFVAIDWADVLHVERRDTDRDLVRHDLGAALPADDLCLKAARALQSASGTGLGATIAVDKRVPWGAGLGGGSSDAATTLLALNRLWGLHWPRERLAALALGVGADVPFFIGGAPAFVEGVGERLTPIDADLVDGRAFVVVKPDADVPTAAVYADPRLVRDTPAAIVADFLANARRAGRLPGRWGRNDLQPAAERLDARVGQALRWLEARCGASRMTGSGSAVFSETFVAEAGRGDQPAATRCGHESTLLDALPERWVGRLCRSLGRHPLADWAG